MDVDQVVAVLLGHAEVPATKFISCKQPLDQPSLAEIASALSCKSHAAVKGLRLEGCAIGDCGARLLADALCSNTDLQTLELPDNYIGVEGATAFAQALQLQNCVLKVLDLSGNPCQVTAPAILQDIEKSLHRNRVIKRAADRRAVPSPSTPANLNAGAVSTPTAARKLSYWPSPSDANHDSSLETEQRLQQLEDNYGLLASELEHIRRLGASLESWSKQVDAASTQVAAVLNLVDTTSQETLQRLVALESWRAAADIASNSVSKVLQKLNEDIKFVDGRLARLEGAQGIPDVNGVTRPMIVEIIDEPPPSERASCSKITPLAINDSSPDDPTATDQAAETSPGPSAPLNTATPPGHNTPAVVPSTPRSMHSSLSDLRLPSPRPTPPRLSPVTWHDNATAMAASLERLNLRNPNSVASTTSPPSGAEDVECTPSPSADTSEPAAELSRQQELELKLAEQQCITDRLTARLEQLERLLANMPQTADKLVHTNDTSVQTAPESCWPELHSAGEPYCSVCANTIPSKQTATPDTAAATLDVPGPSTKPLQALSPVREPVSLPPHPAAASSVTLQTLRESDFLLSQPTPKRMMKPSKAALEQLVSSLESCHSSQPATDLPPSIDPLMQMSSTLQDAELPPSASVPPTLSNSNSLTHSQDPVPSLGSPHVPTHPPTNRPPINSALWLSTSSLVTPGSEASDSDVYQNLLRFVDGMHPNPVGIDLAEKLALLARASQALSFREEQEQGRPEPSVDSSTVRLPTPPRTTPHSPQSKMDATIDSAPSVSVCNSPIRSQRLNSSSNHNGVTPYPLHFSTMSASYDSSVADDLRRPGSSRSSPYKPAFSPARSPCKPTKSPYKTAPPSVDISALARSVLTSHGSSPSPCVVAASNDSTAQGTSVTADEWHSSSESRPLLGQALFSHPEVPVSTPARVNHHDEDLSSLVRDVINQVDQNAGSSPHSALSNPSKQHKLPIVAEVLLGDIQASHGQQSDELIGSQQSGADQDTLPDSPMKDLSSKDQSLRVLTLDVHAMHGSPPASSPITDFSAKDKSLRVLSLDVHAMHGSPPAAVTCSDVVMLGGSAVTKVEAAVIDSGVLRGSIPAPVADMDGSFDLQLPDTKQRATVLPIMPETRELPVDVSRTLPISPTPPTPLNSAAEPIPTLFNMPASSPSPQSNLSAVPVSTPPLTDAQKSSHGSSILMGSVSIHGSHCLLPDKPSLACPPGAQPSSQMGQEGEGQGVMSRVGRLASRPVMLNDVLKASDEMPMGFMQGCGQQSKGGSAYTSGTGTVAGTSFPTTPSSSASSTPRPASTTGTIRSARGRSGTTSATQTPRTSTGSLSRGAPKPTEVVAPGPHKTPRSESRPAGALQNHNAAPNLDKNATSNTPQPKSSSTPFRDASMQRFLLRRGIGKKGAASSPTPSGGTTNSRTGSEHSRSGKASAVEGGVEGDSGKQLIAAQHGASGTGGRKKLMRAMNAITRPIKALIGGPSAQDMPLRMHGTKSRRKSTMEHSNQHDGGLMIAPRALSENTAAYYRYPDPNESSDAGAGLGSMMVRRMLSETAAGLHVHSHRYLK